MSTRAIIGTANDGGFTGRYTHCDGYPTHHGPVLQQCYRELGHDWQAVIDYAVRPSERGYWSSLVVPSERVRIEALPARVPCEYCGATGIRNDQYVQGRCNGCEGTGQMRNSDAGCAWRNDGSELLTEADTEGAEWVYLLDARGITVLEVCDTYERAGFVAWDEEVDWQRIECGEHFERCCHYAWAHFPEAEGTKVGTREWLAGVRA